MNSLHVGDSDLVALSSGCLFITDQLPLQRYRRAKVFDPRKEHLNVFKDMDDVRAWDLSDSLYSIDEQSGANTLTVRNGRFDLAEALKDAKSFKDIGGGNEEVERMVRQIMFFDVVREMVSVTEKVTVRGKVIVQGTEFGFNPRNITYAVLDPRVLGPRACRIIGLLLLNAYKGQVVVKDFDRYGCNAHIRLIEEDRLIAHVRTLKNLSPRLRANLLLIKDKKAKGANFEDAKTLAEFSNLRPDFLRDDNEYNRYIKDAM